MALTHHDPSRDDLSIDRLITNLTKTMAGAGGPEFFAAAEGQMIDLVGSHMAAPVVASDSAEPPAVDAIVGRTVQLVFGDEGRVKRFSDIADRDSIEVVTANLKDAVATARRTRPSAILFDQEDGPALSEICRDIRALPDFGSEVPLVRIAKNNASMGPADAFTDLLVEPITESYARTKMRSWILRTALRWSPAAIPHNEDKRIKAVKKLGLLDTPPEERFDRITRLASAMFDVPVALVTMVDDDRQWFKSSCGLAARETPRDQAFCAHVVVSCTPMIIPDTLADGRFADNPLVTDGPRIRFYAGFPLMISEDVCAGSLCIIDTRPRDIGSERMDHLRDLAALVVREMSMAA